VMGLDTHDEARLLLGLAGCKRGEDRRYRFAGEHEETRFLRMAEDDVFAPGHSEGALGRVLVVVCASSGSIR
jgi:hypothetical protein